MTKFPSTKLAYCYVSTIKNIDVLYLGLKELLIGWEIPVNAKNRYLLWKACDQNRYAKTAKGIILNSPNTDIFILYVLINFNTLFYLFVKSTHMKP